ncbi:MAG TPA: hypothetical protein VJP40_02960 [bacterium]|nr:hypothetical protein [bacterium]
MGFRKNILFQNLAYLAAILALTACSGLTPGGNPGGLGGPPSIGNSLDGGNSVAGGGDLPVGGDGSAGAAVPSTQQSTDGIGLPASCFTAFKVKVKVLEDGEEQGCMVSGLRMHGDVMANTEGGILAPNEDLSRPLVTVTFTHRLGNPSPVTAHRVLNAQCVQGLWVTEVAVFHWSCEEYRIQAQARWTVDGHTYSSTPFEESMVQKGSLQDPIPLEVTFDLGSGLPQIESGAATSAL